MENIKVYEMPGCISCRLKFTLGKAKPFDAYFDGGVPDKGYPAVYVATSIGQQLAIENSNMFKVGKIRAAKIKKSAKVADKPAPKAVEVEYVKNTPATPDNKAYEEVTDLVGAVAVLKGEYGVSASRLKTEASVLRVAAEYNVSFPNLKA